MKRCMILAMAMTVAVNSYGGLFDNVIKNAVGAALPEDQVRQQKVEMGALAEQIDAEIDLSPKVPGVLGWMFGEESKESANRGFVSTEWRDGDNAALNMALRQWFSKVQLEYEPDGRLGAVRLEGNVEKLTDASRLSLYRILRWLEHDFGVVQRQKAQAFLRSSDSYPHNAYFHSHNEYYEAQLDSNYNTLFLQLRDLSVRSNARAAIVAKKKLYEAERERRRAAIIAEQEERARQEELRKAEEHKAYMAKLEQDEKERRRKQAEEFAAQIAKQQQEEQERQRQREAKEAEEAERRRQQEAEVAERQRQREAERTERRRIAEEKEREEGKARKEYERIASVQRISGPLRSCRDGSTRESLYISPEDVKDASQFAAKPVIAGKVPLYKSISSGSSLMWALGQLMDFTGHQAFGERIKLQSMGNAGIDGFDYDGISVSMPKSKDSSDTLCLYCSSEGLDKSIESIEQTETALDGVVVFGVWKTFPGDTAASDVMGILKQRYPGLKVTEKRWKTEDLCLDLVGLVRKGSHLRLEFANDSVRGIIDEEKCEFEKFDLNSTEASFMLYFSSLEALKRANKFAAEEFEQSFNTAMLQIRADVKNGKYKKDIARFKFGAGSVDDFKRGQQLTSETVFVMNTAAKQVLSERSFSQLREDAIKRGKAKMLNIQSEIFTPGAHSVNVLAAIPRISTAMNIFDAKALETLPGLKRKRAEAEQREEQLRKEAQKAKSLDF